MSYIRQDQGQRHATPGQAPPQVHQELRRPGRPLDDGTRAAMEERFQHDLRHVRIHSDDTASASVAAVRANAYTVGRHIVFGAGRYAPAQPEGRRLLAHELTHVLQQAPSWGHGAEVPSGPIPFANRHDPAEREAQRVEQLTGAALSGAAVTGAAATGILPRIATPQLQRQEPPRRDVEKRKAATADQGAAVFRIREDGRLELVLQAPGLPVGVGVRYDDEGLDAAFGYHLTEMLDLDELLWLPPDERGLKSTYSVDEAERLIDEAQQPDLPEPPLIKATLCGEGSILWGLHCVPIESIRLPRPRAATRGLRLELPDLRLRSSLDSFSAPLDGFAFDKSELKAHHRAMLPVLASELKRRLARHPRGTVEVVGHTDAVGKRRYNQGLGKRRAEVVAQELMRLGVPAESLETLSDGEDRLRVDSPRRQPRNRRVEVRFRTRMLPGRSGSLLRRFRFGTLSNPGGEP